MKAIVCQKYGSADTLEFKEILEPTPLFWKETFQNKISDNRRTWWKKHMKEVLKHTD